MGVYGKFDEGQIKVVGAAGSEQHVISSISVYC
jgi:hypothetical protein